MGRRPYFSKEDIQMTSRHIEKMLNVTNYQRNATQNYSDVPLHISRNGHRLKVYTMRRRHGIKKRKNCLQKTNAGEDVEKKEPSAPLVGLYAATATLKSTMEVPQKTKVRITM